jgi:ribosome biogenesis protein MAK21
MLSELGLNGKNNISKWAFSEDHDQDEEMDEEEEDDDEEVEEEEKEEEEEEEEEKKIKEKVEEKKKPKAAMEKASVEQVKPVVTNVKGKKLLLEAEPLWHQISLPELPEKKLPSPTEEQINQLYEKGRQLLEEDAALYESRPTLDGKDKAFLRTLLKSGTLTDRVSALTLLVQESPVHAEKTFTTLMSMARKNNRKEAVMTIASVKDLFVNSLLPDRKLK